MATEQDLQEQLKIIDTLERKRLLIESGLTEADLVRDELENKALALLEAAEYLQSILKNTRTIIQDDEGIERRIDAISRTENLLDLLEDFTVNVLTKGINDIKQLFTDMNSKMDAEYEKNDEQRELEKETLTKINKYIVKHA